MVKIKNSQQKTSPIEYLYTLHIHKHEYILLNLPTILYTKPIVKYELKAINPFKDMKTQIHTVSLISI